MPLSSTSLLMALCAMIVSAKSAEVGERAEAGTTAMDATALHACLGSVHALDQDEKLLTLGSAWNSMSSQARMGFLKEVRRAERASDVDDFTLLQISAVESPEFSKRPVSCLSTALQVLYAHISCCFPVYWFAIGMAILIDVLPDVL